MSPAHDELPEVDIALESPERPQSLTPHEPLRPPCPPSRVPPRRRTGASSRDRHGGAHGLGGAGVARGARRSRIRGSPRMSRGCGSRTRSGSPPASTRAVAAIEHPGGAWASAPSRSDRCRSIRRTAIRSRALLRLPEDRGDRGALRPAQRRRARRCGHGSNGLRPAGAARRQPGEDQSRSAALPPLRPTRRSSRNTSRRRTCWRRTPTT